MARRARRDRLIVRAGPGVAAAGLALVASIVLVACAGPAPSSPRPSLVSASASVASPSAGDQWGPLAVVPGPDGGDLTRTEGTLTITDTCAFLVQRGGPVLLLWPDDRTAWDAARRTITFTNFDGTAVTVADGASVALGGGGGSVAESGVAAEAWLAERTWTARPAAGCPIDPYWAVSDVRG